MIFCELSLGGQFEHISVHIACSSTRSWLQVWDDNIEGTTFHRSIGITPGSYTNVGLSVNGNTVLFWRNGAVVDSYAFGATVTVEHFDIFAQGDSYQAVADDVLALVSDAIPPEPARDLSCAPGNQVNHLSWSNPNDADLGGVVVLRNTEATAADSLAHGVTYTVGDVLGNSIIVYTGLGAEFLDGDLVNQTTYHYRLFSYDTALNYSSGVGISGTPSNDVDADGMDDEWEDGHGGNLLPLADDDQDAVVNLIEFLEQLDPADEANPDDPSDYDHWLIVQPGWNLVSVPRLSEQITAGELFGQCKTGVIWQWQASSSEYAVADDVPVHWGAGYWVYAQKYCGIRMD